MSELIYRLQFVSWLPELWQAIKQAIKSEWRGFCVLKYDVSRQSCFSYIVFIGFIEIRIWRKGIRHKALKEDK